MARDKLIEMCRAEHEQFMALEFPGEAAAIAAVKAFGAAYGYGNLIGHLKGAWSEMLQRKYAMPRDVADAAGGLICPWCHVDYRTGKKHRDAKPATGKPRRTR